MLRAVRAPNEQRIGHYVVVENFLEELKQRIGGN